MKTLSTIWKNTKRLINQILYKSVHNSFFYWDGCPYRWIWKARKDFILPDIKFYSFKEGSDFFHSDILLDNNSVILFRELWWKTKFRDYRFEYCPMIQIRIFGRYFIWVLEAPNGDSNYDYYESILNYLFRDNYNIHNTITKYNWQTLDNNNNWVKKPFNTSFLRNG